MAKAVALGDGDVALQHDEHARPGLAGLEQEFPIGVVADLTEMPHPLDLG
ncbi:hypothetical protein ACVWWO_005589 [Bradyrhizobium sp. F1.13.1]